MTALQPRKPLPSLDEALQAALHSGSDGAAAAAADADADPSAGGGPGRVDDLDGGFGGDEAEAEDGVDGDDDGGFAQLDDEEGPASPLATPLVPRRLRCVCNERQERQIKPAGSMRSRPGG